ncbi:MAG: peptidylprolyl isomerase [Phycisphaerae bacterium]|nr:peptidylprolyl isomerase [Phycisphaerae bacterium]
MKKIFLSLIAVIMLVGCPFKANKTGKVNVKDKLPIARVNGTALDRDTLDDILIKSYAKAIVDDMIDLELIRQYAALNNIIPDEKMYSLEFDWVLNDIAPNKSRLDQMALFNYMLKSRAISRSQYDLILKKQALLRASVDQTVIVTDAMLEEEFQRQYGRKVTVRQIVVASPRTMGLVLRQLNDGQDFGLLVEQYSQDQKSLANGGIVGPISQVDTQLDKNIVENAMSLKSVGQRSRSFQVYDKDGTEWWYILELQNAIPKSSEKFENVTNQLDQIIRQRTIRKRMLDLQKELRNTAQITIIDPRLKTNKN